MNSLCIFSFLCLSISAQTNNTPSTRNSNLDRLLDLLINDDPEKVRYCAFGEEERRDCDTCIAKGSECFFCGGDQDECLPYQMSFPHCDLNDVKHKNCWVNWTAVVVVACIIGGILLVIALTVLCYCFCKLRSWSNRRNKIYWQRKDEKHEIRMKEIEMKSAERSSQRAREMDYYREKYGLKTKTNPG